MTSAVQSEDDPETKRDDLLSFKVTGRVLELKSIAGEFKLMAEACGKPLTPEIATRICEKCGTHLIKLVSPRADGDHAVIRIDSMIGSGRSRLLPSVNAPDIPFAKIIFRPLEIADQRIKSVVDHVIDPDESSNIVLESFAAVFGNDVLTVVKSILLGPQPKVLKLSDGEFPIIFIRSPKGGDLQVTPVSPAAAYMGMKEVVGYYFQKQEKDAPRLPRGRWHRQAVSAKPQNISGAIGGPRVRFLAEMPVGLGQFEAELYRYVRGGSFPRWRLPGIEDLVLRYADLLDRDRTFNNQNTREGLDGLADRLIRDAQDFIDATCDDARRMAEADGISAETMKAPPLPAEILLRRKWPTDGFDRARRVLSSAHFEHRARQNRNGG